MKQVVLTGIACAVSSTAFAQPFSQVWENAYDGDAHVADSAQAIAVTKRGDTYVTGFAVEAGANTDAVTIKYPLLYPIAPRLFGRYTDGVTDIANAITTDNEGFVYICGQSTNASGNNEAFVVKYSPDLVQQWAKRITQTETGKPETIATDVAVDVNGNVVVVGYTYNPGAGDSGDLIVARYDPNGTLSPATILIDSYQLGNDDRGVACAVGDNGYIYVAATTGNTVDSDWWTVSYDEGLVQRWEAILEGSDPGFGEKFDSPTDIALDSRSVVYLTGYRWSNGVHSNYTTISYEGIGTGMGTTRQGWPVDYDFANDNQGNDQATGLSQRLNKDLVTETVVVTGWSDSTTGTDYATRAYDDRGQELWANNAGRYNGPTNGDDRANDVVVRGSGNIYVTGSVSTLSGTDYTTLRYNLLGQQIQNPIPFGPGSGDDAAKAIGASCAGVTHVTGFATRSSTDYDTLKYTQTSQVTAQPAAETDVSLGPGEYVAGNLSSVLTSDDSYYQFRPGPVLISADWPATLNVEGTAPTTLGSPPTELCLQVEAKGQYANILQRVQFRNWTGNAWVTVDQRKVTLNDSIVHAHVPFDPSIFVSSTNRIRCRIGFKADGATLTYPWNVYVDYVRWEAVP